MTDSGAILIRVVETLAGELDEDPTTMEPRLADYVPPDALRALTDHDNERWRLAFDTEECRVSIDGSGTVEVTDRPD